MSAKRGVAAVVAVGVFAASLPAWALFGDDKELNALRGQVQALEERVNRLALDAANRESAREEQWARLQGAIEELRYRLDQLEKRQKDLYLDLDRRLRALSETGVPPSAAPSAPAPAANAATATTAPAAASAPAPQAAGGGGDAALLFDRALRALQTQKSDAALADFEKFLAQYPGDPRAVEARFWAGTAALQLKQYEKARQHFARIVFDHPRHELTPDAMLGLANALQGLGDRQGANDMLARLAERHPNTPAGKIARERLGR